MSSSFCTAIPSPRSIIIWEQKDLILSMLLCLGGFAESFRVGSNRADFKALFFFPLLFCVEGLSSKERWWCFSANLPCPWLCSRVGESGPKIPRLCSQHGGQMQLHLSSSPPARDLSTRVEALILHSECSIIHAKTLSQAYGERLVIVLPHGALSLPLLSALYYACC